MNINWLSHFFIFFANDPSSLCGLKGCFYVVTAFSIAELGSGAIAVDAEWRKTGGHSRGLKRVVIFGLSRLVNLVLLYQIYLVTPTVNNYCMNCKKRQILK